MVAFGALLALLLRMQTKSCASDPVYRSTLAGDAFCPSTRNPVYLDCERNKQGTFPLPRLQRDSELRFIVADG
jgi:hypothetical protein